MTAEEGVLTVFPGTTTRALRYTSRDAVPWYRRAEARQIGAAGFWYTPAGFDFSDWWDQSIVNPEVVPPGVANAVDAVKQGGLPLASRVLGIPYPLLLLLLLFAGYALLRGAGLVPPLRGVVK